MTEPSQEQTLARELQPRAQASLLARDPMAYAAMVKSISAFGIYLIDTQGRIISWNKGAERLTGMAKTAVLNGHYENLFPEALRASGVPNQILGTAKYNKHYKDEHKRVKANGQQFLARTNVDVVYNNAGEHTGFVEVLQDITAERRHEQSLFTKATRDALTGLPNRGYFMELANKELSRSRRNHQPLSVAMIDIDHFKRVNDTRGHSVGDLALQHLAQVLQNNIRAIDIVGRLGGEEFALVLPQANVGPGLLMCDRLRMSVFNAPVKTTPPLKLSISAGVAALDDGARDIETLLKLADKALYRAKRNGRNRVEVWQH